jgi:hypothetical protein
MLEEKKDTPSRDLHPGCLNDEQMFFCQNQDS